MCERCLTAEMRLGWQLFGQNLGTFNGEAWNFVKKLLNLKEIEAKKLEIEVKKLSSLIFLN